ncbi:hypothetical protein SMC26_33020 [Actinomadura fulvescens]|uniref:Uncharacterized protein n=1 Tax=Actinomadura fulvescens TaxID=46160 RepID=A0ABP6CJG9_9ACTN
MLSLPEIRRRGRAAKALAAELRARGRYVSQAGAWMWAAPARHSPGHEIGVDRDGFVWRKGGSVFRPAFAPVDDIPHAADMVEKESGS